MIGKYNISEDLLVWLKETFPNKLPVNASTTIEGIRFLQGQQDIINVIEATYKESIEDVYDE
jgi:hypothetical protein|tara:strand:- start:295 stop:480 length:186 start_codon:yes stop_codon:yes gene_type:complete